MKAIQQLIAYFEERRQLTRRQIEQLVTQGYWGHYSSADLRSLERKIGQSFFFKVTGTLTGSLWGTDIYTSDSELGMACVHAGVLQANEAGVVKVTMVPPIPVYRGSARHGVTSHDWHTGWSGAYQVELIRKGSAA
jgi:hypothetical protein